MTLLIDMEEESMDRHNQRRRENRRREKERRRKDRERRRKMDQLYERGEGGNYNVGHSNHGKRRLIQYSNSISGSAISAQSMKVHKPSSPNE